MRLANGGRHSPAWSANTVSRSPGELADDLEHLGGGSLLLQRFGEVGCALAQLVEQPRVLDGDDGLAAKFATNAICLSVKGRTSWRTNDDHTDQLVLLSASVRPGASVYLQARRLRPYPDCFNVSLGCRQIGNVNYRFGPEHATEPFLDRDGNG